MALGSFNYNVAPLNATDNVEIRCQRRLHRWGTDARLYANAGYSLDKITRWNGITPETTDPLLVQFLTLADRNDSGIESLQVTPNTLRLKAPARTLHEIEQMFVTAALRAGLKPERIN